MLRDASERFLSCRRLLFRRRRHAADGCWLLPLRLMPPRRRLLMLVTRCYF